MDINQIIQKIPAPILITGILVLSIILFVYNDPLRDECEVQIAIFEKKTQGLLSSLKLNRKTQFPQLNYWRDRCKDGNSIGSCNDYFEGLRVATKELREVSETCQIKYSTQNENFLKQIMQDLQIMALVAWGDKPPVGIAERAGWLNETNIRTFCYLKKTFILIAGDESFLLIREKVYKELPGEWSEKAIDKLIQSNTVINKTQNEIDAENEKLVAENRPRAYKTSTNPSGTFTSDKIFEHSIFSVRCDLYM